MEEWERTLRERFANLPPEEVDELVAELAKYQAKGLDPSSEEVVRIAMQATKVGLTDGRSGRPMSRDERARSSMFAGTPLGVLTGEDARVAGVQADQARRDAMGAIDSLEAETPDVNALTGSQYRMEDYEQPGMLLGESQAGQAYSDPLDRRAQRSALQQLQEIGKGGLTEADKNALAVGNDMVAQSLRGQREATLQDMRARGVAGSGAEAAALFGGAQSGANAMSQQSASVLNGAQSRALQALQQSGSLATQMRGQGYGEAMGRGQAVDAFSRDNAAYRRGAYERNVGRSNQYIDNATAARRDYYGIRERQAALRTGQYNQAASVADQKQRDARDAQGNLITGGMKLLKGDDDE